jgi:hypothetical protein
VNERDEPEEEEEDAQMEEETAEVEEVTQSLSRLQHSKREHPSTPKYDACGV